MQQERKKKDAQRPRTSRPRGGRKEGSVLSTGALEAFNGGEDKRMNEQVKSMVNVEDFIKTTIEPNKSVMNVSKRIRVKQKEALRMSAVLKDRYKGSKLITTGDDVIEKIIDFSKTHVNSEKPEYYMSPKVGDVQSQMVRRNSQENFFNTMDGRRNSRSNANLTSPNNKQPLSCTNKESINFEFSEAKQLSKME
jgi:hypothetical protein